MSCGISSSERIIQCYLNVYFNSDVSMTESNSHYALFSILPTNCSTLEQSNSAPCRRICFLLGSLHLEDFHEDFISGEIRLASPWLISDSHVVVNSFVSFSPFSPPCSQRSIIKAGGLKGLLKNLNTSPVFTSHTYNLCLMSTICCSLYTFLF